MDIGDTIQDNQVEVFAKTEKYYKDNPVPKVLNAMNYDIFILGNHELKTAKTVPVKDYEADPEIVEIYKPYHEELRRLNNVTIGQSATDMVPQERKHGVSVSFLQDTGFIFIDYRC